MVFLFNLMVKCTGWPLWKIIIKPKYYFVDRSVQGRRIRGKAIIMSNHTDIWDYAAMMFLFPWRILRCVVAELMYEKNMFMTVLLKGLGTIRVDRNNNDFAFIGKCCLLLNKNGVVELFPESRLPLPKEKELLPFKPSITYLALESGAPIIPVYTDGNYFGKGYNHTIVGTPIEVRQFYEETCDEKENIEKITLILRDKINELKDKLEQAKMDSEA